MPSRTIAIGDIHGCSLALDTLLGAIRPRPEETIVTLGDYINRGPDTRGVIDRLIGLRRRCRLVPLLGNHDEMLLEARAGRHPTTWIGMGGIADARDAIEFIVAGASAVQVGTANFVDPFIWTKLLDGIRDYMQRHRIERIADLVGTVDTRDEDKEWTAS